MTYVIAAYGITAVTLGLYAVHLYRERTKGRKSLAPPAPERGQTNNG